MSDLAAIYITSGVNEAGVGFCTIAAHGDGGTILVGQLDPATVRAQALQWLEVAEAAEQDAAVWRVAHRVLHGDGADRFAGLVITELRISRGES